MCNENKEICSICEGKCCKRMPGCIFPEDIKVEEVKSMIISRDYVFDFWEGDPRENKDEIRNGYYLRPATENGDPIVDASWGGRCIFLTDKGCKLNYSNRPRECRELIPQFKKVRDSHTIPKGLHPGFDCIPNLKATKQYAAIAWIPYHNMIKDIIEEIRGW